MTKIFRSLFLAIFNFETFLRKTFFCKRCFQLMILKMIKCIIMKTLSWMQKILSIDDIEDDRVYDYNEAVQLDEKIL